MYVRVWFSFMRLHYKTKMEYRGDFILGFLSQLIGYGANYLLLWFLIDRFQAIDGWSGAEITLLYSLSMLSYALGAAFTSSQMMNLQNLMMMGSFDLVLVKPINPFFFISSRYFNLNITTQFVTSTVVFIWSINQLMISWSFWRGIYLVLIIISGAMIHAAIIIFIGSLTFILIRSNFLFSLYFTIKDFISYPISIFDKGVQMLLTVFIPLAFVNYLPLSFLLSKTDAVFPYWLGLFTPVVGVFCLMVSYLLWSLGINKYQSAGG